MVCLTRVAAASLATVLTVATLAPAFAGGIGTGSSALAQAAPGKIIEVQWRPYGPPPPPPPPGPPPCWNCGKRHNYSGAAVGAGIAMGLLGAAAIAGMAENQPPPPPPGYYPPPPPPPVYYAPPVYAPTPRPPPPGQCWFPTDTRGAGYWAPC